MIQFRRGKRSVCGMCHVDYDPQRSSSTLVISVLVGNVAATTILSVEYL